MKSLKNAFSDIRPEVSLDQVEDTGEMYSVFLPLGPKPVIHFFMLDAFYLHIADVSHPSVCSFEEFRGSDGDTQFIRSS